jgi:hypothetical protein
MAPHHCCAGSVPTRSSLVLNQLTSSLHTLTVTLEYIKHSRSYKDHIWLYNTRRLSPRSVPQPRSALMDTK